MKKILYTPIALLHLAFVISALSLIPYALLQEKPDLANWFFTVAGVYFFFAFMGGLIYIIHKKSNNGN